MLNQAEHAGKTVLVTGASSGIGAEFARQFHALGADLILVARRKELLEKLTNECNQLRSGSAEYFVVDLTKERGDDGAETLGIDQLLDGVAPKKIDILVNNAGHGSFGCFEGLDFEYERHMIALNVVATSKLAHALIPEMKARRSGAIISLSSVAAFQPIPFMATYAATKAFNLTHSLALRYELAPFGVQVLTVCPGPVDTEFGGVARVPGTVTGGVRDTAEDVVRASIAALRKKRGRVIPCLRAKLISLPSRMLPTSLTTWLVAKVLGKVLKKHQELV